jgi:hypothetical protein
VGERVGERVGELTLEGLLEDINRARALLFPDRQQPLLSSRDIGIGCQAHRFYINLSFQAV